jgi:hypothetical protein
MATSGKHYNPKQGLLNTINMLLMALLNACPWPFNTREHEAQPIEYIEHSKQTKRATR